MNGAKMTLEDNSAQNASKISSTIEKVKQICEKEKSTILTLMQSDMEKIAIGSSSMWVQDFEKFTEEILYKTEETLSEPSKIQSKLEECKKFLSTKIEQQLYRYGMKSTSASLDDLYRLVSFNKRQSRITLFKTFFKKRSWRNFLELLSIDGSINIFEKEPQRRSVLLASCD
ncbi:unnamed protein product [Enterobius vermicularis]|uniref:Uncharacterized protein n=1 Tax=Enterobius vermicularis TaxID=51028 RepID=A0A0N4UU77_ENTVE|nr:unnamed protein product [Enterobius vermicularis]